MKLSCTRDNLHQGLSITSHLINRKVNLPILQNVLVKAEGGKIRFTSTNLEVAVNCTVRGKVDESGEHTIPSKLFFDYVSLLPNETIHLVTEQDNINIKCGNYKTKINGLPASEFPLVPKIDHKHTFEIPADDLKKALSKVLFSVATNEARPELTGILLRFFIKDSEGRLTLASTDSYRLSEKTIPVISGVDKEHSLVIPAQTLTELSRIISVFKDDVDVPSSVSMNLSENQIVFVYGKVELISRVIDQEYPDYKQIIPDQFQTKVVIDKNDFIKAVKTASLFSKTGLFDVTLEFDVESKLLYVKAIDSTRGNNITTCSADIKGANNSVTVNFRYLLDGLQVISDDRIIFEMIDPSNPCLITPINSTEKYRYLVMPIKQ